MANYEETRVKLKNTQLKKIKSAAKIKTGTTLRITKKNDENNYDELSIISNNKTKKLK